MLLLPFHANYSLHHNIFPTFFPARNTQPQTSPPFSLRNAPTSNPRSALLLGRVLRLPHGKLEQCSNLKRLRRFRSRASHYKNTRKALVSCEHELGLSLYFCIAQLYLEHQVPICRHWPYGAIDEHFEFVDWGS